MQSKKRTLKPIKVVMTETLNGVKICPTHQAVLRSVIARCGDTELFNFSTTIEYARQDGHDVSLHWTRRALMELCKAGLITRQMHGVYVVSQEGILFSKRSSPNKSHKTGGGSRDHLLETPSMEESERAGS